MGKPENERYSKTGKKLNGRLFGPGNKAAVGHGPWKVRDWSTVTREVLDLLKNNPEKIEELTGVKVPDNLRHKDVQTLLVFKEISAALDRLIGEAKDSSVLDRFKRWLHGDPEQNINLQGKTLAEIIKQGHELANDRRNGG